MPRKIVKTLVTHPVKGLGSKAVPDKRTRRVFMEEFRREAVAMLLDGHSASSVAERLGLVSSNVLYRRTAAQLKAAGPMAEPPIFWLHRTPNMCVASFIQIFPRPSPHFSTGLNTTIPRQDSHQSRIFGGV